MRYYPGVDLSDAGTSGLSWRRLAVLIEQLPRGSQTRNAVLGEDQDWSMGDHLVANVIDAVFMLAWVTAGNKKNPKPDPIARPGAAAASRRTSLTGREIERRLLEQRQRMERRHAQSD